MYKPIKAMLEVKRNSDGEIRCDPEQWNYYGHSIWSEGNFSCDCNRSEFFARVGGESQDDNPTCGDGAFSVRLTGIDGVVLYQDGEWED